MYHLHSVYHSTEGGTPVFPQWPFTTQGSVKALLRVGLLQVNNNHHYVQRKCKNETDLGKLDQMVHLMNIHILTQDFFKTVADKKISIINKSNFTCPCLATLSYQIETINSRNSPDKEISQHLQLFSYNFKNSKANRLKKEVTENTRETEERACESKQASLSHL